MLCLATLGHNSNHAYSVPMHADEFAVPIALMRSEIERKANDVVL
jgi:hypothetical protein